MKHYGDITKLSGYDLPVVDVITGGSPCQDLSVAGTRSGLNGERSGLFLEQIRIVKEMREHDRATGRTDEHIRPRYMVWENVAGAANSNKGKDFQTVLAEIVKVVREDAPDVPLPEKWPKSGSLMGYGTDGCPFSVAWRLHDAQFWGVPQRRQRYAVVADFGGLSAPEILFERKGLHGDPEQGGKTGEEPAATTGRSPEESSYTLKIRGGAERDCYGKRAGKGPLVQEELSATIGVTQDQTLFANYMNPPETYCLEGNGSRESHLGNGFKESDVMYTINTVEQHAVYDARGNGGGGITPTMTGDHQNRITDYTAIVYENTVQQSKE